MYIKDSAVNVTLKAVTMGSHARFYMNNFLMLALQGEFRTWVPAKNKGKTADLFPEIGQNIKLA